MKFTINIWFTWKVHRITQTKWDDLFCIINWLLQSILQMLFWSLNSLFDLLALFKCFVIVPAIVSRGAEVQFIIWCCCCCVLLLCLNYCHPIQHYLLKINKKRKTIRLYDKTKHSESGKQMKSALGWFILTASFESLILKCGEVLHLLFDIPLLLV